MGGGGDYSPVDDAVQPQGGRNALLLAEERREDGRERLTGEYPECRRHNNDGAACGASLRRSKHGEMFPAGQGPGVIGSRGEDANKCFTTGPFPLTRLERERGRSGVYRPRRPGGATNSTGTGVYQRRATRGSIAIEASPLSPKRPNGPVYCPPEVRERGTAGYALWAEKVHASYADRAGSTKTANIASTENTANPADPIKWLFAQGVSP